MNALKQRMFRSHELLAVSLLQVVLLWPMLRTPYLFDDAFNSEFKADRILHGSGFFEQVWFVATSWITGHGRWFPVGVFQGGLVFELVQDVVVYKALQLAFVVLSTLCFAALLRRLGASPAVAALVTLGATLTFQFRFFHDPILAYEGLQQAVLAEMALSALCFHIWLRDRRWWALAVSLALFAVAASTYDSAPLLCGLHLVIAIAERRAARGGRASGAPRAGDRRGLPGALLRVARPLPHDGRVRGRVLGRQDRRHARQSALRHPPALVRRVQPRRSLHVSRAHVARDDGRRIDSRGRARGDLRRVAAARRPQRGHRAAVGRRGSSAGLGAVLLLAPAAPIAMATRYQADLAPGIAYLPVYLQGFGLALLAIAAVTAIGVGRLRSAALVGAFAIALRLIGRRSSGEHPRRRSDAAATTYPADRRARARRRTAGRRATGRAGIYITTPALDSFTHPGVHLRPRGGAVRLQRPTATRRPAAGRRAESLGRRAGAGLCVRRISATRGRPSSGLPRPSRRRRTVAGLERRRAAERDPPAARR